MRKITIKWTYLVLTFVLVVYGGYSLIYNHTHGKELSILGLVFFIVGLVLLIIFVTLFLVSYFQKKNKPVEVIENKVEEKKEEVVVKEEQPSVKEDKPSKEEIKSATKKETYYSPRKSYLRESVSTSYVCKVGYGPILRVTGSEILDMRTNTYYRIEGNMVNQNGYGPVFEISGNRIRSAFGGYLYEISGDNVNKIFGGFFASISGSYLTTYDLSEKYDISDDLTLKQKLAIVALLFGAY